MLDLGELDFFGKKKSKLSEKENEQERQKDPSHIRRKGRVVR